MHLANPTAVSSKANTEQAQLPTPISSPLANVLRPTPQRVGILSRPATPLPFIKQSEQIEKDDKAANFHAVSVLPAPKRPSEQLVVSIEERLQKANDERQSQDSRVLNVSPLMPSDDEDFANELELLGETPISSPRLDSLPASPVAEKDEKKEGNEAESIIKDELLVMTVLRRQMAKARELKISSITLLNDNVDAKEKVTPVEWTFNYQTILQHRKTRQGMQAAQLLPQEIEFEKFIAEIKEEDYLDEEDNDESVVTVSPPIDRRPIVVANSIEAKDAKRDVKVEAEQAERMQNLLNKIKNQFSDEKAQLASVDAFDLLALRFSKPEATAECKTFLEKRFQKIGIQGISPDQLSMSVYSNDDKNALDNLEEVFKESLEKAADVKKAKLVPRAQQQAEVKVIDASLNFLKANLFGLKELYWVGEEPNIRLHFSFSDAGMVLTRVSILESAGLILKNKDDKSFSVCGVSRKNIFDQVCSALDISVPEIAEPSQLKKDEKSAPISGSTPSSSAGVVPAAKQAVSAAPTTAAILSSLGVSKEEEKQVVEIKDAELYAAIKNLCALSDDFRDLVWANKSPNAPVILRFKNATAAVGVLRSLNALGLKNIEQDGRDNKNLIIRSENILNNIRRVLGLLEICPVAVPTAVSDPSALFSVPTAVPVRAEVPNAASSENGHIAFHASHASLARRHSGSALLFVEAAEKQAGTTAPSAGALVVDKQRAMNAGVEAARSSATTELAVPQYGRC